MKISDLFLKEDAMGDGTASVKKMINDYLVAMKIQQVPKIPTESVVKEFGKKGLIVDAKTLADYFNANPAVADADEEWIYLQEKPESEGMDMPKTGAESRDKVKELAKKGAARKRGE